METQRLCGNSNLRLTLPCLRTAWPVQLRHVSCARQSGRRSIQQHASNISMGAFDGADDQQQTPRVDYAPKDPQQLWKAAIKLPMYSVGVVPVLVGAAAAYLDHSTMPWLRAAGLLLGSVCVIAWLNLSNDAFDASTGVDIHKAESVVNLTGNRTGVLLLSKLFLAAGVGLLSSGIAAAAQTDGRVTAMLAAAIACGYVYQGPPFRFSYKGLGEPLCFWAFGPLATTAFYLACSVPPAAGCAATASTAAAAAIASEAAATASTAAAAAAAAAAAMSSILAGVSPLVLLLSVVVGITTTVILFCSHWHQIQGDVAAGKMSPLVRLGTTNACKVLLAATASPYVIILAAAAAGVCPLPLLAALVLSLPAAKTLVDYAYTNHTLPARIAILKKFGVKWHVAVGACLTAGLAVCKAL